MNKVTLEQRNERDFLFFSYILCVLVFYFSQSNYFTGPFITLDEPTYFKLSKSIFENFSFMNHMQYYPLYPFMVSLSFLSGSTASAYEIIKILNVLFYTSLLIPLFYICKKLFDRKLIYYILPIILIFLPQRILFSLVWAEPLYYPLLGFALLFFINFVEDRSIKNGMLLGTVLGCLYLTKPIGGVLFIACFLSLTVEYIFCENQEKKRMLREEKKAYFAVLFTFMIFFICWSTRNLINGHLIGYASEQSLLKESIYNFVDLIKAIFYQLTYFFTASYFIFTALFFCALFNIKNLKKNVRPFILAVLLYEMGVIAVSGIHRIQSINLPLGRYTSAMLPYIIIIAIFFLCHYNADIRKNKNIVFLIILSGIMLLLTMIYSPLPASLYSYGFLNNFDLAIWNNFINYGALTYEVQNVNTIIVPVILFVFSIVFILVKSQKLKCGFCISLLAFMVISGVIDVSYIKRLSNNTRNLNAVCKYAVKNLSPEDELYLDTNIGLDTSYVDVWFDGDYKKIDYKEVVDQNMKIDFGSAESPIEDGFYGIQAPWVGAALYNDTTGMGFDPENLEDLHGTATAVESEIGLNDVVFGSETSNFYVKKRPGKYKVKLNYNFAPFQDLNFEFDLLVNGTYIDTVNHDTKELEFTVDVKEEEELIDFELRCSKSIQTNR